MPFSFTSNEVFNGALRNFANVHSQVSGLSQEDAGRLLEQLKRVEGAQLPPSREAYLAAVELDEGVRVMSRLINVAASELTSGMAVQIAWEKLSDEISLYVFEPTGG